MAVEYLDKGNDDGTCLGQSASSKIGFYGLATPIVQPTLTVTVTATGPVTACATDILAIQAFLKALGLSA
jgi:hypothetical protein